MKPIFIRTFERIVRPVVIVIAIIFGLVGASIVGDVAASEETTSFISRMNEACLYQHLVVFFAFGGLFLMNACAANASGIIANEMHEGTFRLLVAKPNSRKEIVLAKISAAFLASYLLYVLVIAVYYGRMAIMTKADGNIIDGLFGYLPAYLLYGLLVTFIFVGISSLLSSVLKKKITALLPMLLVVIAVLGVFPIIRVVSSLTSGSYSVVTNWYDLNYHFASMFRLCVETCGEIRGSSVQISITNILMNLFKTVAQDADIVRTQSSSSLMMANNTLNTWALLIGYLAIGCVGYVGSFVIISKKDV